MNLSFPDTGHEFVVVIVPVLTALLALVFLLMPKQVLYFMGLEARPTNPEAVGEGRSSFAGALLAVASGCLLLQDPIALQPGLNFMLACAWSIAAFGRVLQMSFDGGNRKRVQVRLILALGMAFAAWSVTEIPSFNCVDPFNASCKMPGHWREWFITLVAVLTFVLGLISLFVPNLALKIMKLQTRMKTPFARGETRGTLAGFYSAVGGTYLLMPQPADFVAVVLGAVWIFTGLGRLVSIIFDRGWTRYNFIAAGFELVLGFGVVGFLFRMF